MRNDVLLPAMHTSGLYHVDCNGCVWTKKKLGGQAVYTDRWRRAECGPAGGGRWQVRHEGQLVYAARLVWFWFYGPIGDYEIDHKDNNKLNNHPDNLQRLTRAANQRKAEDDGLVAHKASPARGIAMRAWWAQPGRREQMSRAARRAWAQRKDT